MNSGTPIIQVRDLWRRFENIAAVQGLSFDVMPGQVVGFIGANGAGKTTTMRMMVTLDIATAGSIHVCGYEVVERPGEVRKRVGWMPDAFGVYSNVTVQEYLDFFARAQGYKGKDRHARVQEVMEFTDLASIADRHMDKLSKGMGQRLCLGRTLLHDPEVLILDEPAAGLDPKARVEFKRLVRILAEEGKTIFISSHILSELAEMCDTMLFIDAGKIVHLGSADSLLRPESSEAGFQYVVQINGPREPLQEWILLNPGIQFLEMTKRGVRFQFSESNDELVAVTLKRMVEAGFPVIDFRREERKLEDAFVEMLKRVEGGVPK